MGPDRIVVVAPPGELAPCIGQAGEHLLVQQLIAQFAVEALDEGILCRLARRDVVPIDTRCVLPIQYGPAGQFGSVVADNGPGLAVEPDQGIEFAGDPYT